jgi:predicted nucleotide-binding protein
MATNKEAIVALGKLIEEANRLLPYYRTPQFREKLTLWTQRGSAQLSEWNLSDVADRFGRARGDSLVGDTADYLNGTLRARVAILEALRDDFASHPEFYTERAKAIPSEPDQVIRTIPAKPDKVFLGHGRSLLWHKVERWLGKDKGLPVEAWETASHAGEHVIQVLQGLLDSSTFAVLLVTGEDATAEGTRRARQNVVHEIGLFQGRLGFNKVALLEQEATESFSNIDGLQAIPFPDQKVEAAFPELERMLKREGILR